MKISDIIEDIHTFPKISFTKFKDEEAKSFYKQGLKIITNLYKDPKYSNKDLFTFALGLCLWSSAVPGDEENAIRLIENSANSGLLDAQIFLGKIHLARKKESEAETWFKRACEQNNPDSLYRIGKIYLKNGYLEKAREFLKKADESTGSYFGAFLLCKARDEIAFRDAMNKMGIKIKE